MINHKTKKEKSGGESNPEPSLQEAVDSMAKNNCHFKARGDGTVKLEANDES